MGWTLVESIQWEKSDCCDHPSDHLFVKFTISTATYLLAKMSKPSNGFGASRVQIECGHWLTHMSLGFTTNFLFCSKMVPKSLVWLIME